MKITVISYSFTGNNEALAASIAAEFTAERIKITEPRPRTTGTIVFDILFNRTPKVSPMVDKVKSDDMFFFVGPVWLGHAATPFRAFFKNIRGTLAQYAFISISGGALGLNPGLANELTRRAGKKPVAIIDLHIAGLLPPDPKPTVKVTSAYRLKESDVKSLTTRVVKTLRETIAA